MKINEWQQRLIPVPITLVIALSLWLVRAFFVAEAFLMGAAIVWLGEALFVGMLFKKIQSKRAKGFFKLFCFAEILKLVVYGGTFLLVVSYFHQPMAPVLSGFVLNLMLYWMISCKALGDL